MRFVVWKLEDVRFFVNKCRFERVDGDLNGREDRINLAVEIHFRFEERRHCPAVIGFKRFVGWTFSQSDQRDVVDERPIRFDQVIGKVEGIRNGIMVKPKRRIKPDTAQLPGDCGPQKSVTIVQKSIGKIIIVAAEIAVRKERIPIRPGRSGLGIIRITGADGLNHVEEFVSPIEAIMEEAKCLSINLGAYDLAPKLFLLGHTCLQLKLKNFSMTMVAGPRE